MTMKKLPSLSIFFPCLNDSKAIPYLLCRAYQAGRKVTRDMECIVIDDGSDRETKEVLASLQLVYPRLRILTHKKNLGYGAALRSGFAASRKSYVFYTDGDGQYDPIELIELVKHMKKPTDVVNGYLLNRADRWYRRIIGWVYRLFFQHLYDLPIQDVDCDFRLIPCVLLKHIHLMSSSGGICVELIAKLRDKGARFIQVGIHHHSRLSGRSQFFHMHHLWTTLCDHIVFYRYMARINDPMV